ncbi:MAG: hypothetical protein QME61_01205 [Patescibacteria group bacterium]|nr:hypothetical protein [Patescibacteria group bacterium]
MIKFPPFSAETFLILPLAIGIDLISIILLLFGLDDFGLLDIIGFIFIGTWLFFRRGKIPTRRGSFLRRIFTGRWNKFLTPFFGEIIPYLGVLPFWSLSVYFNLTQE